MNFIKAALTFFISYFVSIQSIIIFNDTKDFTINYMISSSKGILEKDSLEPENGKRIRLDPGSYFFNFYTSRPSGLSVRKFKKNPEENDEFEEVEAQVMKYSANFSLLDYKGEDLSLNLSIEQEKLNEEAITFFKHYKISLDYTKLVVKKIK